MNLSKLTNKTWEMRAKSGNYPKFHSKKIIAVVSRGIDLVAELENGERVVFCSHSKELENYHNQIKNGCDIPNFLEF